ncbi:MAG TPA: AAA family ATPase [Jatrophihabitantaceae bacterium]|nr:AAA family ATPase [Jatrophihabitantaceae bacterium]
MGPGRVLERDSQLAALASYADEARAGDGRMVLVGGEAGIGKSTLVEELERGLPCAAWWWGACDGLSTPRALGPLSDIAVQAGGELRAVCAADAARDVRFDALTRILRTSDDLRVVVIEDVHWADDATLDMLRFVGRRIRDARVLFIVTYRDDALGADEPLRITLGDLATNRSTRRVKLGPLSEHAVRELAAGTELEPAELYRLTGGSPFLLTEVLATGTLGVPGSARDVLLARAAGLTPDARSALDHAALIGTHISPALLRAASGASAENLDELLASGILVADGDQLRFRHEIARQAIQEQIPPHHASTLHRNVLDALLAAGCGDEAQLAFHADVAGDDALVLEHAPRAARAAAAVASHREAAAQLERAVRYADSADVATRAGLLDEYAEELALVERWDDATTARVAAIELWHEAGNPLREGRSESRLAAVMWRLCRASDSVAASRRARELLEPLGPTTELAELYSVGADAGDDAEAKADYIERAVEIAGELDQPDLTIRTLNGVGYLASGRLGDYEIPMRRALRIALEHGLQQQAGRSYANLTEYLMTDFRLAEAEPMFLEALAYCDEHDVSTYGNCVRGHYALALLDQGRWGEALHEAQTVLATRASPINRLTSLIAAGMVNARRGFPAAEPFLAEAEAVAVADDEPLYLSMARVACAEAAWLAGDADAAQAQLALIRPRLTELEAKQKAAVIAWEKRLGVPTDETPVLAPYAMQVAGPPRRAAETWEKLGMPYHAALALGDSDDEADLREALSRLDAMSPPAAHLVRRRMRKLGMRAIPVGVRASTRADPDGLTRREREVLELVRRNLTNEQIAERLVISVKTVDHHVSSVLAKLGATSRRQVSA